MKHRNSMIKRLLASVLSASMIVTSVQFPAFASDEVEVSESYSEDDFVEEFSDEDSDADFLIEEEGDQEEYVEEDFSNQEEDAEDEAFSEEDVIGEDDEIDELILEEEIVELDEESDENDEIDESAEITALNEFEEEEEHYDVWFEYAGKEGQEDRRDDYDNTWIFNDEHDLELHLNVQNLAELNQDDYEIIWNVMRWNDETEDFDMIEADPVSAGLIELSDHGRSAVINGESLSKNEGVIAHDNYVDFFVTVKKDDKIIAETSIGCGIAESRMELHAPHRENRENELLPGYDLTIGEWDCSYWIENGNHPFGEEVRAQITNAAIVGQYHWDDEATDSEGNPGAWVENAGDEYPEVLTIEEHGDCWNLKANSMGRADVELTYVIEDNEESLTLDYYVNGDKWEAGWQYPENSAEVLPNSEMEITTNLNHNWLAEDNGRFWTERENVQDYFIEIGTDGEGNPDYNTEVLEAEVKEDGQTLLIRTKDKPWGTGIGIRFWAVCKDENGDIRVDDDGNAIYEEVDYRHIMVNVSTDYKVLVPTELSSYDFFTGESITVEPAVYRIFVDDEDPENPEQVREKVKNILFRWEWDRDWEENIDPIQITYLNDRGKEQKLYMAEDDTSANTSFAESYTITKLDNWDNIHVRLIAEELQNEGGQMVYREILRNEWNLNGTNLDCGMLTAGKYREEGDTIWYDERREIDENEWNHTWVYAEEENFAILLEDDALTELDPEKFSTQWSVINHYDEEGHYQIIADENDTQNLFEVFDDGRGIILNGPALAENEVIRSRNNWFEVRLSVMKDGEEVSCTEISCEVREAIMEFDAPNREPNGNEMIIGDAKSIMRFDGNTYIENQDYPFGYWMDTEIVNVEKIRDFHWECVDEEQDIWNEVENDPSDPQTIELQFREDEEGWDLLALNHGGATVRMYYRLQETGEDFTYDMDYYVNGDIWYAGWDYPNDSDCVLTNETMQITTNLRHRYQEDDGAREENIEDYRIVIGEDEDGNPCYDPDVLDVVVEEDGKTLTVSSKDAMNNTSIQIWYQIPERDENGEEFWNTVACIDLDVNITDYYTVLVPKDLDNYNYAVGDSFVINPAIKAYYTENVWDEENQEWVKEEREETIENIRFRWEWDRDWENDLDPIEISWMDGEEKQILQMPKEEDGSDRDANMSYADSFTITKLMNWDDMRLRLIAEEPEYDEQGNICLDDQNEVIYHEIMRKDWNIFDINFDISDLSAGRYHEDEEDPWFEERRWIDEDWNHTLIFNDENDLHIKLEDWELTDLDKDQYSTKWAVVDYYEDDNYNIIADENDPKGLFEVYENGRGIILNGAALAENEQIRDRGSWFDVRFSIYKNDQEVTARSIGCEVCESEFEYHAPNAEDANNEMVIGDEMWIDRYDSSVYVRNGDYLNGADLGAYITNVEKISDFKWECVDEAQDIWEKVERDPSDRQSVNFQYIEEEDRWRLIAEEYGGATIRITYQLDEMEDEFTHEMDYYVNGDIWYADWQYVDGTDTMLTNKTMELTTSLVHRFQESDGNEYWGNNQEIDDYRISIREDEDGNPCYDTDLLDANVNGDGKSLTITSYSFTGGTSIPVVYWILNRDEAGTIETDENGQEIWFEVTSRDIWVNVSEYFEVLYPTELEKYDLAVGESITIEPVMKTHYVEYVMDEDGHEEGEEREVVREDVRFRWEWDRDWEGNHDPIEVSWMDGEEKQILQMPKEDDGSDRDANISYAGSVTITKQMNWDDMRLRLIAEAPDYDDEGNPRLDENGEIIYGEIARNEWRLHDKNYDCGILNAGTIDDDGVFTERRQSDGGWHTTIYNDDLLSVFLEGDALQHLSPEEYELKWDLFRYTDGEGNYEVFADEENTKDLFTVTDDHRGIILDGTKLYNSDEVREMDRNFQVRVSVIANGETVHETELGCSVREEEYNFYNPNAQPYWNQMLPGEENPIGAEEYKVYISDKEHPFGEEIQAFITDVTVGEEYHWGYLEDEDRWDWLPGSGNAEDSEEPIIEVQRDDENNLWMLRGLRGGSVQVLLTYSYENVENATEEVIYSVSDDIWTAYPVWDDNDQMLPNSEKEVGTKLYHRYIVWDENDNDSYYYQDDVINDYRILVEEDDGTPTYDTNLFSVSVNEDEKSITVESHEEFYGNDINIRFMVPALDENGDVVYDEDHNICWWEVARSNVWINVCSDSYRVDLQSDLAYEYLIPGDTVTFESLISHQAFIEGNNQEVDTSDLAVYYDVVTSENISVSDPKQNGNSLTVEIPNDAPEGSWVEVTTYLYQLNRRGEPYVDGNGDWIIYATNVMRVDIAACEHAELVTDAAVEATCTTAGKTEGSHCKRCEAIIVAQTEIEATGHVIVTDAAVAATCTTAGKSEGKHCSKCGTVLESQNVINALGHVVVTDAAVAATCTTDGKTAGSHCSRCNTVLVAQTVINKKGHTFDEWVVTTEPTVLAEGVKTRTCSVCAEKETASVAKIPATIKLNVTKLPIQVKQSAKVIEVTMGKGDYVVSWSSNKPKIAKVNKKTGKITGVKVGKAVITVKLKSGKSAKVTVTVQKKAVTTSKITVVSKNNVIKKNKLTLKKKAKDQLLVALNPLTSKDKITFTSSNKKYVTVDKKGNLVAKAKGTAKITVKAGKKKAVITVTVK